MLSRRAVGPFQADGLLQFYLRQPEKNCEYTTAQHNTKVLKPHILPDRIRSKLSLRDRGRQDGRLTCEPFIDDRPLLGEGMRYLVVQADEKPTIVSTIALSLNSGGISMPCAIAARIYQFVIEHFCGIQQLGEQTVSIMPDALGFPSTRTGLPWRYFDNLSSSFSREGLYAIAAAGFECQPIHNIYE